MLLFDSIVCVRTGWTNGKDTAKGGQEDGASSGLEENAFGAQSHSWITAAARRESPGPSGAGQ